jgi:hypothetical protein
MLIYRYSVITIIFGKTTNVFLLASSPFQLAFVQILVKRT